ncbi:hypothetical protein PINS_up004038 [Pythium insidiosum]|nr:hypothetical protein PINS_up004038 [Pythium insidiosum]
MATEPKKKPAKKTLYSAYKHGKPLITVIGLGGAGSNAVNNMIASQLEGVEFIVANTDSQALGRSLAPHKITLGKEVTKGLGAGSKPQLGKLAAEMQRDEIEATLKGQQHAVHHGRHGRRHVHGRCACDRQHRARDGYSSPSAS